MLKLNPKVLFFNKDSTLVRLTPISKTISIIILVVFFSLTIKRQWKKNIQVFIKKSRIEKEILVIIDKNL
tara:strand:- start:1376 stop:1585 length:210 start_codon:yes stop_codon:yes gene_type:complete